MIPEELPKLVRLFEGLARVKKDGMVYPYLCPAGYPTQGYGVRVASMDVPAITQDEAEMQMQRVLPSYISQTLECCPSLAQHPRRLAAITDFCFNLGKARLAGSTLRRRINSGDWAGARVELSKWVYGRNPRTGLLEKLPGLVARRAAEAALL